MCPQSLCTWPPDISCLGESYFLHSSLRPSQPLSFIALARAVALGRCHYCHVYWSSVRLSFSLTLSLFSFFPASLDFQLHTSFQVRLQWTNPEHFYNLHDTLPGTVGDEVNLTDPCANIAYKLVRLAVNTHNVCVKPREEGREWELWKVYRTDQFLCT